MKTEAGAICTSFVVDKAHSMYFQVIDFFPFLLSNKTNSVFTHVNSVSCWSAAISDSNKINSTADVHVCRSIQHTNTLVMPRKSNWEFKVGSFRTHGQCRRQWQSLLKSMYGIVEVFWAWQARVYR